MTATLALAIVALAASRQEVLRVLGGSASATLDVDTDEGTGRRSIRVRIEPDE